MFSINRVYRNNNSTYNGPALVEILNQILRTGSDNQQIWEVLRQAVPDTKQNRTVLYYRDPVPFSFSNIEAYTIHGNGMKPIVDDTAQRKKALEVVESFFSEMNAGRQTIDDAFTRSTIDNNLYATSVWRILYTSDSQVGIDLSRLDPLTFEKHTDDKKGTECYVQKPFKIDGTYASENAFYNAMKDSSSLLGTSGPLNMNGNIVIPNKPEYVVEFEFYEHPPVSTILDGLLYKQWILWYMKMYSDRYWSPYKVGYVGDPKTIFPNDPDVMANQQNDLLNAMLNMRTSGAMATAGYNHIEEYGKNSASSSEVYPTFIDHLDKQTMYALSGSMGQRDASGNELAVSRSIEDAWLRVNSGKRTRHKRIWTNFFLNQLFPENGIHLTHQQFHFSFSPMSQVNIVDLMNAIEKGQQECIFKDVNEPREWVREIYDNIGAVDEATAKKLKDDFMELNKKPEPAPAFGGGKKPASGGKK